MQRFRNYLSEQVVPTAQVSDGSIDIEKPAVRGQINATLQGVTAQPAVTPYIVLQRIAKALAYFHIILPKRAYLEGDRGVEVIDVQQFGPRMGMTDQGEFVKEVPAKYFLFISYRTVESVGVTYAKPVVGGMFKVTAKLVDQIELDRLLSMAEISLAEDAACRQNMAKMTAPKEPMKDVDSSTEGTEKAVSDSQRKKDKKLSAGSLEELWEPITGSRRHPGSSDRKRKAVQMSLGRKHKGEEGWNDKLNLQAASLKMGRKLQKQGVTKEETLDETRMPAPIIRRKQKLASMSSDEKAKKFAGKSEEELKSMARRHGYGKDSDVYSKHKKLDEGEDEDYMKKYAGSENPASGVKAVPKKKRITARSKLISKHGPGKVKVTPDSISHTSRDDKYDTVRSYHRKGNKVGGHYATIEMEREEYELNEKLTKGMPAGDVISDFVHSKSKTFKGDTKKKRISRALGAYYGMHPEKSRKE